MPFYFYQEITLCSECETRRLDVVIYGAGWYNNHKPVKPRHSVVVILFPDISEKYSTAIKHGAESVLNRRQRRVDAALI